MLRSTILSLCCVFALATAASATIINVPAQQPTIQAGITAAATNDTVQVAKGSYAEASIAFNGKKVVLRSSSGRDSTVINGQIIFRQVDTQGPTLDGFTVSYSHPLVCFGGANPKIKNCIFRDGNSTGDGGGATIVIASPVFDNCIFTENYAENHGGAISAMGADGPYPCYAQFTNCEFIENSGGNAGGTDVYASTAAKLVFTNCLFRGDHVSYGGSICSDNSRISITNCTFLDHDFNNFRIASDVDSAYFKMDRSIVDFGDFGLAFLINAPMDSVKVTRCVLFGYGFIVPPDEPSPGGYIFADPLFCDTISHDCHISTTSPCAPANNPWGVLVGKYGTACTLPFVCGNADGDDVLSIADVVFIVNYIFAGGLLPSPPAAADPDCSGDINIADAVYLVNYIFAGGTAPCAGCPKGGAR
jgi:predicted outer membrane repeat protein